MALNLQGMSKSELKQLSVEVNKALKEVDISERRKALEAAKVAAAKFGYSLAEITAGPGRPLGSTKPKRPPKYFNPKDKNQTWSGSGRQPFWFKDALRAGIDPSKLEI